MPPKKKIIPPRAVKDATKGKGDLSTEGAKEKENIVKSASSASQEKTRRTEAHTGIKFIPKSKKQTVVKPFNFARRGKSDKQILEELLENDETIDLATPDRSVRRSLSCSNLKDLTSTLKPDISRSSMRKKKAIFSVKRPGRVSSVSPIKRARPVLAMTTENSSIIGEADKDSVMKPLSFEQQSEKVKKNEVADSEGPRIMLAENSSKPDRATDKKSPIKTSLSVEEMSRNIQKNRGRYSKSPRQTSEEKRSLIPVPITDRSPIDSEVFSPSKEFEKRKESTDIKQARPMGAGNLITRRIDKNQLMVNIFGRRTRSQTIKEKEDGHIQNEKQNDYVPKKINRRRQELL